MTEARGGCEPAFSDSDLRTEALFATLVHTLDLARPDALNASLLGHIRALQAADPEGLARSNEPGLGGWHSHNGLHKDPAFDALKTHIEGALEAISDRLTLAPRLPLTIVEIWSIVNPPRSYNRAHIHPGAHLSGVYYVQTPPGCGVLHLLDPRIGAQVMPLTQKRGTQPPRGQRVEVLVAPQAGRLVLFPAWLAHRVEPNLTDLSGGEADRVIVSFNVRPRPSPVGRNASERA